MSDQCLYFPRRKTSFYWCLCHREDFRPSFLGFLESDFALLRYKTLYSEVAWTEENAGKSEFTLFASWLITLHKVLWCQNTIKISINKQEKQGQSTSCAFLQNGERRFLLSFHMVKVTWPYNWPIISFTKYNFIILFFCTAERDLRLTTFVTTKTSSAKIMLGKKLDKHNTETISTYLPEMFCQLEWKY